MKGYKAFKEDLSCLGYQYELDKTNVFDGVPVLCETGFHFCTILEDIVNYYCYSDMRVFEVEASGTITNAEDDCSKRACSKLKLIREISLDEVAQSITQSELAYFWGIYIGNRDTMINKIVDSNNAYYWAKNIGNRDVMIDKITESYYAYLWALNIGNLDIMIDKITDSYSAYLWAIDIGNRDIMIDKVVEYCIVQQWLLVWPDDKQYFIDKGLI